jgi:hypothetical protein
MISVIQCTARQNPSFDWLCDSLANTMNLTGVAAELIVIDKLLWRSKFRDREEELEAAVKNRFPFRHVPPKPSAWQGPWRKTKRDFYDLNNARNTGLCLARGSYVALADDCSVLDPLWLARHAKAAEKGIALAGSFMSYNWAEVVNGVVINGELHPSGIDGRGPTPCKAPGGWLYGLNSGYPLNYAIHINGYDELYASHGGSEDCDFGVRLERAGCFIAYDPSCLTYQILANHEPICEIGNWDKPNPKPPKELMLNDGKMHFANEKLIQDLAQDTGRIMPLGNDFDLKKLHASVLQHGVGAFPTSRAVTHHWVDNQPLEEME